MKRIGWVLGLLAMSWFGVVWASSYDGVPLQHVKINPNDVPSLQRGAKLYINYCSGCHSLNFMRYNRLAEDLHLLDKTGQVDTTLVKDNLIFTKARIADTIQVAMSQADAKRWFGVAPPDLSVIARARGTDWLYTYLLDFYEDAHRPLGVNNLVFNETAMPDVLAELRGVQVPVYAKKVITVDGKQQVVNSIQRLVVIKEGSMSPQQFKVAVADIVNFLAYVGEPYKTTRQHLGYWVLGFLILFSIIAYLLKREYWRKL